MKRGSSARQLKTTLPEAESFVFCVEEIPREVMKHCQSGVEKSPSPLLPSGADLCFVPPLNTEVVVAV